MTFRPDVISVPSDHRLVPRRKLDAHSVEGPRPVHVSRKAPSLSTDRSSTRCELDERMLTFQHYEATASHFSYNTSP